jgi:NAD(P)-dependent dehydrogenase (short-subunit alcohol dehydrogenase family)
MATLFSKKFNPAKDLPDLKGKVVIVTGGNSGIGYATIKHLARRGAKVYMAARNESKAAAAIANLKVDGLSPGNGQVMFLQLDLDDPRNAKKAAEEYLSKETRLDILINNGATHNVPYEITTDGILNMTIINYISPFVLTHHLLPILKHTAREPGADVRIVNVSWKKHRDVPADTRFKNISDFNREFATAPVPAYARCSESIAVSEMHKEGLIEVIPGLTKLATILWMKELQKRLDAEDTAIVAISIDPGDVDTYSDRLTGSYSLVVKTYMNVVFKSWDKGAYNSVIAAASPIVRQHPEKYKGAYLEGANGKISEPSRLAQDPEVAAELWKTTEDFVKSIGLN